MTDDEAAFLASIRERPDDDSPRLEYADWLEEHEREVECGRCLLGNGCPLCLEYGHLKNHETCYNCGRCGGFGVLSNGLAARAEFIRVQCRVAELESDARRPESSMERLGYDMAMCRELNVLAAVIDDITIHDRDCVRCLKQREKKIWHEPLKLNDLPDASVVELHCSIDPNEVLTRSGVACLVRRGFVHSITCTASDCIAHLDTILAAHPVREVTLTTWPDVNVLNPHRSSFWRLRPFESRLRSSALVSFAGREYEVAQVWPHKRPSNEYECADDLIKHRWPGITFHLPMPQAPVRPFFAPAFESNFDEFRRQIRETIAASLGVDGVTIGTTVRYAQHLDGTR